MGVSLVIVRERLFGFVEEALHLVYALHSRRMRSDQHCDRKRISEVVVECNNTRNGRAIVKL